MRSPIRSALRCMLVAAAIAAVVLAPRAAPAQPGTIEEITVEGIFRMSRESFMQAFGIRKGDPYDVDRIRSRFRALWDLKVFSDITIDAEDAPGGGKALIIKVVERPILSSVTYEDNKVLTTTQIEDRLAERKQKLELGRPLDIRRLYEAESTIRDYLGEKGFLDAKVWHQIEEVTKTSKTVHFFIRPGGKTKIRHIEFVGNEVFKDRRLRKELKLTKPRHWWWPWSSKNLYHPVKWDQDVGAIRDLYQNAGYLDVEIRPPVVDVVSENTEEAKEASPKKIAKLVKAQKVLDRVREEHKAIADERAPDGLTPKQVEKWDAKHRRRVAEADKKIDAAQERVRKAQEELEPGGKKWVNLTVAINEGRQYHAGETTIHGNTVFSSDQISALMPVRKGMILSNALLKLGIQRITRLYEDRGYLYANVVRQIERHEDEPVADVRVNIVEEDPYYVDSIEFRGNTSTQDRVLRREFRINEGDLFNRTKLDVSVRKVNQLGYVKTTGDAAIEPLEGQNRVAVTVPVEEQGRNEIQVGGGYSGVDGAFFTGLYSTRNFLGRGQTLAVSMQVGGRTSRYSLSFLEPWFLNRPYTAGFSIYRQDVDYGGNLRSTASGGGVVFGRQLGIFSSATLRYAYQDVTTTGFTLSGGNAQYTVSSLTPGYVFDKINNPFRPSRGWSFESQFQVAGGPLGGTTAFLRPILTYTAYRKALRRSFFGFHVELGQIREFSSGTTSNTATVNGIPRTERFWLGGDTHGPRVFETRAVTPLRFVKLDATGKIVEIVRDPTGLAVQDFDRDGNGVLDRFDLVELGGDRFFLIQNELVYPVGEQMDVALFLDVGNALFEDTSWGFTDFRASAGVELRFYLPVFPYPLRLIYGFPIQKLPEDRTSSFTFSIGRSF